MAPNEQFKKGLFHYMLHIDITQWDGSVMFVQVGDFYSAKPMHEIEEQLEYFFPTTRWRLGGF